MEGAECEQTESDGVRGRWRRGSHAMISGISGAVECVIEQ